MLINPVQLEDLHKKLHAKKPTKYELISLP